MNEFSKVPDHASQATPEGAALVLFQLVANAEKKTFDRDSPDRKWILSTYKECLQTVRSCIL